MSYYLSPLERIVGFHFARPGSFEIHPQSDSVSNTEYKLWSPSKDVWQADIQVQTTGNTDWKGALGAVTWDGPPSRYWLQINDTTGLPIMGISTSIYKDGVLFASSTYGEILGAALMQVGSKTYLVAATWNDAPDTMHFIRIEYDGNGTIGAWELLLTIPAGPVNRPSTIVTFNDSGTECMFLSSDGDIGGVFGFDNISTVTIGDGIATEDEQANLNVYDDVSGGSLSLSYSRIVTIGTDNGCAGGVADQITDNCPTEYKAEHDWSQSNTRTTISTRNTATIQKGIIAADYKGDIAVFATIEWTENKSINRSVTRDEASTYSSITTPCDGTPVVISSNTLDLTESYTISQNWGHLIDLGFVQLTIQERVVTGSESNSGDVTAGAYNYSFSSSIVQTDTDRRIHFLDLRHDVVLYTEEIITTDASGTQSGTIADAGPGGTGGSGAGNDTYPITKSTDFNTILIDNMGTTVLDASSLADAPLTNNINVPENESGCPYSTPSDSTTRISGPPVYGNGLMPWVTQTYDILLQAFVTDGKNNQVVSLEIIRQTVVGGTPTGYTRLGTYHYSFTADDMDTLTGLTGTNRFYNPVNLIGA